MIRFIPWGERNFVILTGRFCEPNFYRETFRSGFSRSTEIVCYTVSVHCVKSVRIRSYSGLFFLAFGLNTDQNNSEYGHFLRSDFKIKPKGSAFAVNIRLGENLLKTSWRHLGDVFSVTFFCLPRRLEDIIARRPANTSWIRLEYVLKTSWKTSWKRLENVLKTSWRRFRKTYCKYVLKTSSRRLGRRKVLRWRRLQDVLKTSWKTRNVCWVTIQPVAKSSISDKVARKETVKIFYRKHIVWCKSTISESFLRIIARAMVATAV